MHKIVLFGANKDTSLTLPLCRALEKYGGVLHFGNSCASEYSLGTPNFVIFESSRLDSLQIENAVVIFKPTQNEYTPKFAVSDNAIAVAEADNAAARKYLSNFTLPCVTCGMSAKNTITLSSMGEGRFFVSVQKPIKLLAGTDLEPCEFSVQLSAKTEGFPLLAACAVLILTENFDNYIIKI